jgi:hypothetical protein
MDRLKFDDRLELLGVLVGLFVVIAGLGTLVSQPWSTTGNSSAAIVQTLGVLATIAVGVVVVLVTRSEPLDELLPIS